MVHTATLSYSPASKGLYERFIKLSRTQYYRQGNKYVNTTYRRQGIVISAYAIDEAYKAYILLCRVNFKRLIEQQNRIAVYKDTDYYQMIDKFDQIMERLNLPKMTEWDANRIDYCVNIKTPYVEQYIKLMGKGDIPPYQRLTYDPINRNYTARPGSVYLPAKARDGRKQTTGSITVNFYDKHDQLKKEQEKNADITDEVLQQAKNILRLEVQCHRPKLEYIKRKYHLPNKRIASYLSPEFSFEVIEKAILSICKKGDYQRKSEALRMIDKSNYQHKTKDRLKLIIAETAKQHQSIWKVKQRLIKSGNISDAQWGDCITRLNVLNINPVTISDNIHLQDKTLKQGLPNIYDLFLEAFDE